MAKRLGAQIVQVSPGYLNVVQARAREYCQETGARLAPFGFDVPGAVQAIAVGRALIGIQPDEVWCAAGSGFLARGLAQAWPNASLHVVQVGRTLSPNDVAGATVHVYPKKFKWPTKKRRHSQATRIMTRRRGRFALPGRDRGACSFGMSPDRHNLNMACR